MIAVVFLVVGDGSVEVYFRIIWVQLYCLGEVVECFVRIPFGTVGNAPAVVRFRIPGVELNSLGALLDDFVVVLGRKTTSR